MAAARIFCNPFHRNSGNDSSHPILTDVEGRDHLLRLESPEREGKGRDGLECCVGGKAGHFATANRFSGVTFTSRRHSIPLLPLFLRRTRKVFTSSVCAFAFFPRADSIFVTFVTSLTRERERERRREGGGTRMRHGVYHINIHRRVI